MNFTKAVFHVKYRALNAERKRQTERERMYDRVPNIAGAQLFRATLNAAKQRDAWIVLPCSSHSYSCRDYIWEQRARHNNDSNAQKSKVYRNRTTNYTLQSHETGINYSNCIWLVFGARPSQTYGQKRASDEEGYALRSKPKICREKAKIIKYGTELCAISEVCVPSYWICGEKIWAFCVRVSTAILLLLQCWQKMLLF